jgi:hypothetical protein
MGRFLMREWGVSLESLEEFLKCLQDFFTGLQEFSKCLQEFFESLEGIIKGLEEIGGFLQGLRVFCPGGHSSSGSSG